MTLPVVFSEKSGVGFITLNSEETLNALTLQMVELMIGQLRSWQYSNHIYAIFLEGCGEKAFCAGGDVQTMRLSSIENQSDPYGDNNYAETFFEKEYTLNYFLHNYAKPIVIWGHGIVMGGGLGLLAGCSHRIVTEKTCIAMPEVTIALFPDVGGSYFLNRMPGECGKFLALTAVSINGPDAIYAGMADQFITHEFKQLFIEQLLNVSWLGDFKVDGAAISDIVAAISLQSQSCQPEQNLQPHQAIIDTLCASDDVMVVAQCIRELHSDDIWLRRAQQGFAGGSPLAIKWIFKQLQKSRHYSLKEALASELLLATNIMRHTEFAEGVRALLVDKDQSPQWQFKTLIEVDDQAVESFFNAPWPQNPLASL